MLLEAPNNMAMVDEHGRLFGRFNLVDAVLVVFLAGLVPLAYGAYALFRTPMPRLTAVEPAALVDGPNLIVKIRGEHLRPYLRVSFGNYQGATFLFRSSTEADIALNPMPVGVYDVILYDFAQERARLPQAFTVKPSPLPDSQVVLIGVFGNLTSERAAQLKPGATLEGMGSIVLVGRPSAQVMRVFAGPLIEVPLDKAVQMPASLQVGCFQRAPQGSPQCVLGDTVLQTNAVIMVKTPIGALPFQVDQVRGITPLEQVRATVRFSGLASLVGQIRKGDTDNGPFGNEFAASATVLEASAPQRLSEDTVRSDVTMLIQAQRGAAGWVWASAPLRVGVGLVLKTARYELSGTVMQLTPEWKPASPPR